MKNAHGSVEFLIKLQIIDPKHYLKCQSYTGISHTFFSVNQLPGFFISDPEVEYWSQTS